MKGLCLLSMLTSLRVGMLCRRVHVHLAMTPHLGKREFRTRGILQPRTADALTCKIPLTQPINGTVLADGTLPVLQCCSMM